MRWKSISPNILVRPVFLPRFHCRRIPSHSSMIHGIPSIPAWWVGGGGGVLPQAGAPDNALVQPDGRLYSTRGFCPFRPLSCRQLHASQWTPYCSSPLTLLDDRRHSTRCEPLTTIRNSSLSFKRFHNLGYYFWRGGIFPPAVDRLGAGRVDCRLSVFVWICGAGESCTDLLFHPVDVSGNPHQPHHTNCSLIR